MVSVSDHGADAGRQVRISKIASRYLVFDLEDVVYLRRHRGICAVFVGTMPQNPTQNVFMGLPVELLPEEARVLVESGAACVVDGAAAHLAGLGAMDETARRSYLQSLKTQRRNAQRSLDDEKAARMAEARERRGGGGGGGGRSARGSRASTPMPARHPDEDDDEEVFGSSPSTNTATTASSRPRDSAPETGVVGPSAPVPRRAAMAPGITPATSGELIRPEAHARAAVADAPSPCPLYAHLNARGYYITPGLRFGGDYSVYPGDPFRYHAHFLATSYGWDEEIPVLELIGSGRLGTAVKKGFLLGAQKPPDGDPGGSAAEGDGVRAFCIEWAGM